MVRLLAALSLDGCAWVDGAVTSQPREGIRMGPVDLPCLGNIGHRQCCVNQTGAKNLPSVRFSKCLQNSLSSQVPV